MKLKVLRDKLHYLSPSAPIHFASDPLRMVHCLPLHVSVLFSWSKIRCYGCHGCGLTYYLRSVNILLSKPARPRRSAVSPTITWEADRFVRGVHYFFRHFILSYRSIATPWSRAIRSDLSWYVDFRSHWCGLGSLHRILLKQVKSLR